MNPPVWQIYPYEFELVKKNSSKGPIRVPGQFHDATNHFTCQEDEDNEVKTTDTQ